MTVRWYVKNVIDNNIIVIKSQLKIHGYYVFVLIYIISMRFYDYVNDKMTDLYDLFYGEY